MLALSPSIFGVFSSSAQHSFPVKTEQVLYERFYEGLFSEIQVAGIAKHDISMEWMVSEDNKSWQISLWELFLSKVSLILLYPKISPYPGISHECV